jgi:flagellar biosynthesis protein FlhG
MSMYDHDQQGIAYNPFSKSPTSTNVHGRERLPTPQMLARHRAWSLGLPLHCSIPSAQIPLIIAVGGGKGGVGKSMISANLAAKLARLSFRVAAIDMDCGGSNLHTYFGINGSSHCLGDFVVHGNCGLQDVLAKTSIEGLYVAASQRDDAWSVADALTSTGMTSLWNGLTTLTDPKGEKIDVIILDLGAGSARHTIDLFCTSHVGIVAALPEPTSIENSYLFLRTLLFRLLENAGYHLQKQTEIQAIMQYLAQDVHYGASKSYTEKLRLLYQSDPQVVGSIAAVLSGRLIGIVLNQTRSQADIDIGKAMELAGQRYFGFNAQYLGYLNYDEAAWKSLRNKRLLLQDFPQSILSKRIHDMALSMLKGLGV